MTAPALSREEGRIWTLAAGAALAAHLAVGALVLAWAIPAEPRVPEPVVLVELPPQAAAAPAAPDSQPAAQPRPDQALPQPDMPPIDVPPARMPVPASAMTLPPPPPTQPARQAASAPPAAAPLAVSPTGTGSGANATPGSDPRAKKQEADYFALVSAHLNRRKVYPAEARQARQQGVVTVRFTVDRSGAVTNVSIKRSSGHDTLDRATLDLLQRVAPLPRMPASMVRDQITLSLPIDYSLRTS